MDQLIDDAGVQLTDLGNPAVELCLEIEMDRDYLKLLTVRKMGRRG